MLFLENKSDVFILENLYKLVIQVEVTTYIYVFEYYKLLLSI